MIEIENGSAPVIVMTLTQAKKRFGKDELFEYLQGYSSLVFHMVQDNEILYPVTFKMMGK